MFSSPGLVKCMININILEVEGNENMKMSDSGVPYCHLPIVVPFFFGAVICWI